MNSEYVRIDTLYLLPRPKLVPSELVSEWVINHFGCPFGYDSEKRIFYPHCYEVTEYADYSSMCRHSPLQIVYTSPFVSDEGASYKYDSDTRIRYLQPRQNFTFVIDGSLSLRCPNEKGKSFLNDAVDAMRVLLHQLTARKSVFLPGSRYRVSNMEAIVTILLVLPGSRCCTLLSGWRVSFEDVNSKLSQLVKSILRVGQELIERASEKRSVYRNCNSLVDLLKHGILSSSLFVADYATSSVVLFTDGAFSINNSEVLDRSLTHLKSERVRCCFVLLNVPPCFSPMGSEEGAAFEFASGLGSSVPQIDLCTFLAQSTDGFIINASTELLPLFGEMTNAEWTNLREALWTIPVTRIRCDTKSQGDLNWVPVGTLQLQKKVIQAPVYTVIVARLRDGYRLCKVRSVSRCNNECTPEITESSINPEPKCPLEVVQIELEMPWKVGIIFHVIVCGLWHEFHDKGEHDKLQQSSPFRLHKHYPVTTEKEHGNSEVQVAATSTYCTWTSNRYQCHVTFSLRANYSLLYETTVRPKKSGRQPFKTSLYSLFIAYHRQLSVTDQHLEHVVKFFTSYQLAVVPEVFRSGMSAAFTVMVDASGKQIVVENCHQPLVCDTNSEPTPIGSQFLQYWRMFLELDLLECYRWMNVHSIYGILEYDSQLPTNLHLPSESNRYTVSLTCRQSLDLLYASLVEWCDFVLLENNTYVRFLCIDPITKFANCEPSENTTPSNTGVQDLPSGAIQLTNSMEERPCFCVVRLEVKSPEFRVRIAFLIDTPVRLQSEVVQQLTQQIKAIHFPQRGRQAIPKSRHKSGAMLLPTETARVPPLQRSWEETSCCHLFHTRLDRLILNRGLLTSTSLLGLNRDGLLNTRNVVVRKPNVNERTSLVTQKIPLNPLATAFSRPNLGFNLLKHHLHHESRVWVVQPLTLAVEGLRTLFSSLLNLRLQEGFHLARVGPQPGFLNLVTEVKITSRDSHSLQPCLLQYLLYPFVDVRSNETVELNEPSEALFGITPIKNAIATVVQKEIELCAQPVVLDGSVTSIFDLVSDEVFSPAYPFKSVQIVTEVWIQPIEGHIIDPPPEVIHWTGARFEQLASRIFEVDQRCVTAYVTLERLFAVLQSSIKKPIQLPVFPLSSSVPVPDLLGCLKPDMQIFWAESNINNLIASSPQVTLLYSLIKEFDSIEHEHQFERNTHQTDTDDLATQYNNELITSVCSSILRCPSVIEVNLSVEESKIYTVHLVRRSGLSPTIATHMFPKWRCFVALGALTSLHNDSPVSSEEVKAKAMITMLFLPASMKDCRHPLVELVLEQQWNLVDSRQSATKPNNCFPVFLYACSRPYLSFLLDDRWTYKVPPDSAFELLHSHHHNTNRLVNPKSNNATLYPTVPTYPPEAFLATGCQNQRLTSELSIIWHAIHCTVEYISTAHLDAFVSTIYRCLTLQHTPTATDVQFVLGVAQQTTYVKPFSLNITSFLLCCCSHFFKLILAKHAAEQGLYSGYSLLLTGDQYNILDPTIRGLYIAIRRSITERFCTHAACGLVAQLFERFTYPLPGHPGIFILKNKKSHPSGVNRIPGQTRSGSVTGTQTKNKRAGNDSPTVGATALDSDESDTSESFSGSNQAQVKALSCVTKRVATHFTSDCLLENISKFFQPELQEEEEMTLFVQIRARLIYGQKSTALHMHEGLPLFCLSQFVNILEEMVLSEHQTRAPSTLVESSDCFELDLSLLQLRLEIIPIIWLPQIPAYLVTETLLTDETPSHTLCSIDLTADEPVSTSQTTSQFHCPTLTADTVSGELIQWVNQNVLISFNRFQLGALCRFIFRLSWEIEDEIVCALRSMIPVSESTIQLVLRHIEDTQKLMTTPLFNYCTMTRADSYSVATDPIHLTDSNSNKSASSANDSDVHDANSMPAVPRLKSLMHPAETVIFGRVRLDFVSYSSGVFNQFLRRFEAQSFSSSNVCLQYLNGAYFLRLIDPSAGSSDGTALIDELPRNYKDKQNMYSTIPDGASSQSSSEQSCCLHAEPSSMINSPAIAARPKPVAEYTPATVTTEHLRLLSSHKRHPSFTASSEQLSEKQDHPPVASNYCPKTHTSHLLSALFSTSHGYEAGSSECESKPDEARTSKYIYPPLPSCFRGGIDPTTTLSHTPSQTDQVVAPDAPLPYSLPPYWMLFRVSSNSVSVFFHHTDSHCKYACNFGSLHHKQQVSSANSVRCYPLDQPTSSISCHPCATFHLILRSIQGVVRLVNQKTLLDKLRTERMCDILLVPDANATLTEGKQNNLPKISQLGKLNNKHRSSKKYMDRKFLSSKVPYRSESCYSSGLDTSERERFHNPPKDVALGATVLEETDPQSPQTRRVKTNRWTSISSTVHFPPPHWYPGYFACPIQLTDRIRLHPRVFYASSIPQPGLPTEKGKRIVAALRKRLEKPAIYNQPDMFFLIDFASRASPAGSRAQQPVQMSSNAVDLEGDPVFYMQLTVEQLEPQPTVISDCINSQPAEQQLSESKAPLHVLGLRSSDSISAPRRHMSDKNELEHFLQYTLRGIEKPSRHLCKSVREMLQTRLDALVLEHFSDSLSRNAVNRLSSADFSFLVSRRAQTPKCHCYVALPKFFLSASDLPYLSRAPRKLILAFCHYLKQNLSLFLHAIKLEQDSSLFGKSEILELFLYNRPRAHGVAKPGVATLVFQLLARSDGSDGSTKAQHLTPHTIMDWALPSESAPSTSSTKEGSNLPSFEDLHMHVKDYSEVSECDLSTTLQSNQLVLSIQIWERGDADIDSLKSRVKSTALHALYDLITEFFVLTAPVKVVHHTTGSSTSKPHAPTESSSSTEGSRLPGQNVIQYLNPYIPSVVLPWLNHGRVFDSPLVIKVTLNLASVSSLGQLLCDFLRPFNSNLSNQEDFSSPGRSSATTFQHGLNSASMKMANLCLNGVTFYVYKQAPHDKLAFALMEWDKLQSNWQSSCPGQSANYLIVGRNFPAWRQLIRRGNRKSSGVGATDTLISSVLGTDQKTSSPRTHAERPRNDSAQDLDVLLRMQPLRVTLNIPPPTTNLDEQPRSTEQHTDDASIPNFSKGTATPVHHPSETSMGTPGGSKLPAFCPIDFVHSPSMPLSTTMLSPKTSTASEPGVDRTSGSSKGEASTQPTSTTPTPSSTTLVDKPHRVTILAPRQAFCLISIEGRQITLFTYNWSKEESEGLVQRLTMLVEWHNSRYKLLSTLSMQKLGLFHHIDTSFVHPVTTLVHNTCPPELSDGQMTNAIDKQQPQHQLSSNLTSTTNPSGATGSQTRYASRRRHPTSGTDSVTPLSTPATSGSKPLDSKSNGLLRLFQDCSQIPPLDTSSPSDLVYRHGRQALTAVDWDRRRAHKLDLISLPFRAWQEGRKRRTVVDCATATATSPLLETRQRSTTSPKRESIGDSSVEAALVSEPLQKRLRRYSATRMACRHLHTICTPILFCPTLRAQVVRLMQLENATLRQVAEACYAAQESSTTKTSQPFNIASYPNLLHGKELRDLVAPSVPGTVQRVHSLTLGSNSTSVNRSFSHTSLQNPVDTAQATQSSASIWLNWSPNTLVDTLDELTKTRSGGEFSPTGPHTSHTAGQTHEWVRQTALTFLRNYAHYIEHGVGFRAIQTKENSTGITKNMGPGAYMLLHRVIHLAGVHIMEVFIRHSHLYVRLGTIELGRFSRAASRAIITGPLSAEVITQAAASAAVTAASVRRNFAVSVRRDAGTVVPGSETRSRVVEQASTCYYPRSHAERTQYMNGFSWDESSRLCDYTHVNSFSYDYYLRVIQDYLAAHQSPRHPCISVVRKLSHVRHSRSSASDTLGIPDYPMADFLADLYFLVPRPPVFARNCLLSVKLSRSVGAYLRPEQVFHHLIEDHANYDLHIVRMTRTNRVPMCQSDKASYTFGIYEQHLVEPSRAAPTHSSVLSRQGSFSGSSSAFHPDTSSSGQSTTSNAPLSTVSPNYSITAILVADDKTMEGTSLQPDSTGQQLHLILHLFATNPINRFPKSRLVSAHDAPCVIAKGPIEWPAVAPTPYLHIPNVQALPRTQSTSNDDKLSTMNECVTGATLSARNRYTSVSVTSNAGLETTESTSEFIGNTLSSSCGSTHKWHVSYLGMWPAHQVPIQRTMELAYAAMKEHIFKLVERSGLDCHKNLLWYHLFDAHHYLSEHPSQFYAPQSTTTRAPVTANVLPPTLPSSSNQITKLPPSQMTSSEIEELAHSAPFEMDIFLLDKRLEETIRAGARYLCHVGRLINRNFLASRGENVQPKIISGRHDAQGFVWLFHDVDPDACQKDDSTVRSDHLWTKHHMALLSPAFTDGFVLLSWAEKKLGGDQTPRSRTRQYEASNYKDFSLRALFRTVGDPMNPGSMKCLIDSGQQIQGLFFERSPLASLVTNFVEILGFCIWRGLHSKYS